MLNLKGKKLYNSEVKIYFFINNRIKNYINKQNFITIRIYFTFIFIP